MLLRLTIAATIAFCAVTMATVRADAQSSSARAITLVVPFPAGGPTDTIGRIIAEGLQSSLGQPVIVENAPGATGSVGTGKVARAEADGHTLILERSPRMCSTARPIRSNTMSWRTSSRSR